MRLFGLIGNPLSHSFSKRYFTDKFLREGIADCRYELFPLESINQLTQLINDNPGLRGLNVTVPYKQQVIRFLDENFLPGELQACNCIRIQNGKLSGYNTDHTGFEKSLVPLLKPHHKCALILGNGGATQAVAYVLRKLGIDFEIASRELHEGSTLVYADINADVMNRCLLIINTTPAGMYPHVNDRPPIPYQHLTDRHLLYDLIYNPEKTLFLQKGEEMGAITRNGEEMLVLQAEESWKIWNS